jgi:hypothetical protein
MPKGILFLKLIFNPYKPEGNGKEEEEKRQNCLF